MKINLRQIRVGLVVVSLILVSGFVGYRIGRQEISLSLSQGIVVDRTQPMDKSEVDLSLFWQVWDKLSSSYLIKEDIKPQEMVWGAIRGMTSALGDPYTVFLPPEQNKAVEEDLNGAFEGVGIQLGFIDGNLGVIAPLIGMPAEAQGVKAGDLILRIKDNAKEIDVDTLEMSLPEAVKHIRGTKGTPVTLTIFHEGASETEDITIVRDTIVIKSVELEWVGDNKNVAHVRLTRFGGRTESEWSEAVGLIKDNNNAQGVVLDLRNNPGGYLQGAVQYGSEFLERGLVVVQQEDSKGGVESYSVSKKGKLLKMPLVVLVNKGSASSSEILAGALRDHDRAKIVGEKSFGKGTIQEALDMGQGAGLHVTTAKWLLPKGDWVNQTEGITPEVEIVNDPETEDIDEQLEKAVNLVLNI
jgi:carboxyl-terminal processing protease